MSSSTPEEVIVTASLTSDVARVARGMREALALVDEVLDLDHETWESTLHVGDIEFYTSKNGPYPNNQMRISVRPSMGVAALHYADHDDPEVSDAYSYTPNPSIERVHLIFSGETGRLFPRSAVISISHARAALVEWLRTRARPKCIEWRSE
ncbi:Imm1 family immunity protein [Actinophytocola glycyrrhizae]|uniref:Imm1 family immunity protein n=1 Tax=Actinophytocola glycyrrhizae TaxID=2044873 RepID=A0ABV9S3N0_9PSEU